MHLHYECEIYAFALCMQNLMPIVYIYVDGHKQIST